MNLNEMQFGAMVPIGGYGPGFFRVAGTLIHGPALIHPNAYGPWGGIEDIQSLLDLGTDVDVVFLGTGSEIAPPPKAMREALEAVGIGLEVMNSPAACRTYNICLSEGRRVAAALLPVG